jgi:hypothetical protein
VLSLTARGISVVTSWQQVNARIVTDALASLDDASRDALARALPALGKLTSAVDARADDPPVSPGITGTGDSPAGDSLASPN